MFKIIKYFQQKLTIAIPFFMIIGVLYGYFLNPSSLKVLILPLTFLMVYPMMINLQIKEVFSEIDLKLQVVTQIINFFIIPFIAYALGKVFFAENTLVALGLLLAALLPTSGMTISWTGFAKGNINAAIKMTVIGLILGSIATPFFAKWLMGAVVDIPLVSIFKQILFVVFIPMVTGLLTQFLIIKKYGEKIYKEKIKHNFPSISTLGVLGIVFVAMALKAKAIIGSPVLLLNLFVPLFFLYVINYVFSTIVAKLFFTREDGLALVYGTVMRNLSIALAIAMNVFGEKGSEIALIIALAYILQVQSAAWYVKFTENIFGLREK